MAARIVLGTVSWSKIGKKVFYGQLGLLATDCIQ